MNGMDKIIRRMESDAQAERDAIADLPEQTFQVKNAAQASG